MGDKELLKWAEILCGFVCAFSRLEPIFAFLVGEELLEKKL